MNTKYLAMVVLSGLLLPVTSFSQSLTLEQRLMRVENLLANQAEQLQKNDQIRTELTEIRELLEKQVYEMEQIKQRQRNLYQDMDRRLSELESGKPSSGMVSPVVPTTEAVTAVVPVAAPTAAPAADVDGKDAYERAFGLLKEGRYAPAITGFRQFMQQYPQSKLLDNAQYWLAEACYVSRDYATALKEFQKVLTQYKDSDKLQASELKVGYTYYEMQDWANARTTLESVMVRYPKTTVATKADERLQRMKREGR